MDRAREVELMLTHPERELQTQRANERRDSSLLADYNTEMQQIQLHTEHRQRIDDHLILMDVIHRAGENLCTDQRWGKLVIKEF